MSAVETARASVADGRAPKQPAVAIDGLTKTFRLPRHRVSTLKERALHPLRRTVYDELRILQDVSFTVGRGELLGIVGRNGSGKSTLLKCLAGIYRADAGSIRVAGRLAPFIELGVGFNPDLTARDNVLINAVMMGLSPREARNRFDAIVDFAELREFLDLKLKNYSSGMQVRLAFSTMVHTDADVLLIDEVLAVGDAAFQQKCFDVFHDLRDRGRTVVLVTHDMTAVERFCHRAILLDEGRIALVGDPIEVGQRYLQRNFEAPGPLPGPEHGDDPGSQPPRVRADIADVWVQDAAGRRVEAVGHGEELEVHCLYESHEAIDRARLDVWIDSADDARVFGASTMDWAEPPRAIGVGERLHVRVRLRNPFVDGRWHVGCSLLAGSAGQDIVALDNRATSFVSYGARGVYGLARVEHQLSYDRWPPEAPR